MTHFLVPNASPPISPPEPTLRANDLYKTFVLHHQGGVKIPVLQGVSLILQVGECVALQGQSGSGKSTFMRSLYANYRIDGGAIWVKHQGNWVNL
ncbi:MAG: ATP-binding cassette domain-containing protein, partial [Cyanophyceae cyanobacterium]